MGELFFAEAIHIQKQAKIDAERMTQKSGNEKRGAETALQQFSAGLSNLRRMDAAGSAVNDSAGNSARLQSRLTNDTFNGRVAAAEDLGRAAAMAGAAGVGGASVEAYNVTARLQTERKVAAAERAVGESEWASGQQRANAVKAAVAGIDNNTYRANQDYRTFVDHKKMPFMERIVAIGATVAATVYGGPQAGQAVMGIFEARQANRNGDYAGASEAMMGSLQNGMGAARSMHVTGGDPGKNVTANAERALDNLSGSYTNTSSATNFFNNQPSYSSVTLK